MITLLFLSIFADISKATSSTSTLYTIPYGKEKAPHHLINFFDIECEHCIHFYKTIWPILKKEFIDTDKLRVIFTPYPVHQTTITFMACCEKLSIHQKQILFETLMKDDNATPESIQKMMSVLKSNFQLYTTESLQETLRLTTINKFDFLPVLLFDDVPLSEEDQDHILDFLRRNIP